ncbi:MAG: hypothetical protein AAFO77_02535 [Pseudomonadota bacterium]
MTGLENLAAEQRLWRSARNPTLRKQRANNQGRFVRTAVTDVTKTKRLARMSGLGNQQDLFSSKANGGKGPIIFITYPLYCRATKSNFEPKVTDAAHHTNSCRRLKADFGFGKIGPGPSLTHWAGWVLAVF